MVSNGRHEILNNDIGTLEIPSEWTLAPDDHQTGAKAVSQGPKIRHRASGTGWRVVPPGAAGLLTLLEFSAGTPAGPGKSLKQ